MCLKGIEAYGSIVFSLGVLASLKVNLHPLELLQVLYTLSSTCNSTS